MPAAIAKKIAIAASGIENEAKVAGLVVEARIVVSLPYVMSNEYVGKVKYTGTLRRREFFT